VSASEVKSNEYDVPVSDKRSDEYDIPVSEDYVLKNTTDASNYEMPPDYVYVETECDMYMRKMNEDGSSCKYMKLICNKFHQRELQLVLKIAANILNW